MHSNPFVFASPKQQVYRLGRVAAAVLGDVAQSVLNPSLLWPFPIICVNTEIVLSTQLLIDNSKPNTFACLIFSQPVPLWGGLRQSRNYVYGYIGSSAVISSSSSSYVSVEEGSSRTCVGVSP